MKTNKSYKNGPFITDPKNLQAYALYFSKYVQAYRREGINVYAVHPQNEPAAASNAYPQCCWNGSNLNIFLRDYLVPQLRKDNVDVQVWLGTIDDGKMKDYTTPVLGDPTTNPLIAGVGYQYPGQGLFAATRARYPDKQLMQTETECYHGQNSWSQGMATFGHIAEDLNNSANSYDFWNMILNEKHTSTWNWTQNSLIILDAKTQKVIYNPDFYALKHFAHFVQPGAHRIDLKGKVFSGAQNGNMRETGSADFIAFQNPGGEVVLAVRNKATTPEKITLQLGHSMAPLGVPANSMNTVVLTNW
jgi:glucosylceramidase